MYITAQGCRLRNDLYCVEWDVKPYYTIPVLITPQKSIAQQIDLHHCIVLEILRRLVYSCNNPLFTK